MMKRLTILGMLALAILACAQEPLPVQGGKQQQQADSKENKPKGNTPAPFVSEVCKENADNAERYAYYKAHPKEYLKAAIAPANLSNWILAGLGVMGGVLALFTILTMRWSAHRQLRAYVIVERGIIANVANPQTRFGEDTATVARLLAPGVGPTAQITIKNAGQTPAYDLVHWGSISIREYPLKSKMKEMPRPAVLFRSVLGPSIPEVKTVRLPEPLLREQIQGLRESTLAIYCHGEIHYRDGFKKKRVTCYRVMYCAITGIEIGVSTDLTLCEEGNTAD